MLQALLSLPSLPGAGALGGAWTTLLRAMSVLDELTTELTEPVRCGLCMWATHSLLVMGAVGSLVLCLIRTVLVHSFTAGRGWGTRCIIL